MQNQKNFIGTCLLLCCSVFATDVWSEQLKESVTNTNPSPEILGAMIPENQQNIITSLAKFALQYKRSSNAVQQYLIRQKRKEFLAKHLEDIVLTEWIGRIKTLRTTEKGKASLRIELATDPSQGASDSKTVPEFSVTMGTWNNSSKDLDYNTLIFPETPLHNWLANINFGEWVVFSGNVFLGDEDYLKEASLTETEAMLSPQFIIKFEVIDKIDFKNLEVSKSQISGFSKSKKLSIFVRPELTIRYYQDYRLSNYNWDYQSYIERWHQLVDYHWRNHPPSDYLESSNLEGGEVFVLVTVGRDGHVSNYQVSSLGEISDNMREAALEATRTVTLPPLPEEFPDEKLKVEFRFEHLPMIHLIKAKNDQTNAALLIQDKTKKSENTSVSKMAKKHLKKQLIAQARLYFHEELRQELTSHFQPFQRFDPSLDLRIELSINNSGKVVEQKLSRPGKSVKYRSLFLMD
tara:strand:+ start:167 stop:1555 length:1389 start_codon:yes stop_codon:yes gene_type:complete